MSAHETRSATLRDLIAFYERHGRMPFPIQGGEGDPPKPEDKPKPDDDLPEGLGDAGKEALKQERKARRDAEKLAADREKELETLRKEKADADDAKRKEADEDAKRKGEFEKLATERGTELETVKQKADADAAELKAIWDDRMTRMTEGMKDFPKDAKGQPDATKLPDWDYYPGDEAEPKARWAWFEKARTRFEAQQSAAQNGTKLTKTPKPEGELKEQDEAARTEQARTYRDF